MAINAHTGNKITMIDELTEIEASDEVAQEAKPATIREALSESGESVGIEVDDADDLIEPFDPDLISIEQRVVPMDTLIRRLKQGSIRLSPNFQRKEVWDNGRRSRLIESIILRIPLPMFYVAADVEGRWDVVDGLQRLSTIRNFILGDENKAKLRLESLEFLGGRLNGKTFDDIDINSPAYQRMINTIMETEMRFTIINPGTPEEVKRNVFKRLNTGGLPLTSQEIRHALYQGQVTDLLATLAESKSFKEATDYSINDSRMAARELVLYFLAFAIFPHAAYKGNMDTWLSNAMRVINLMPNLEQPKLLKIFDSQENILEIKVKTIEELVSRFELAMTRGMAFFDKYAFRKSLPVKDSRRTPVNKALFETWGNILAELNQEDFSILLKNKAQIIENYCIILNGDTDLLNVIDVDGLYYYPDKGRKIKNLVFFVLGKTCNSLFSPLQYATRLMHDNSLSDEEREEHKVSTDLYKLLRGEIGESLYFSISRNASEVESVKRRYYYLGNLVKNTITYAKQEQAA
jgi:hypothetical protein